MLNETLNVVLMELVKIAIVTGFALAVPILVKILQRVGLQVTAEKQAQLNQIALLVASEVEEWAAAKLKGNLQVTSGDKLERAVAQVLDKVPGITEAEAKAAIRAALPQIGLGAAAGLKELGKGLAQ